MPDVLFAPHRVATPRREIGAIDLNLRGTHRRPDVTIRHPVRSPGSNATLAHRQHVPVLGLKKRGNARLQVTIFFEAFAFLRSFELRRAIFLGSISARSHNRPHTSRKLRGLNSDPATPSTRPISTITDPPNLMRPRPSRSVSPLNATLSSCPKMPAWPPIHAWVTAAVYMFALFSGGA
jgi:hypothetical protein